MKRIYTRRVTRGVSRALVIGGLAIVACAAFAPAATAAPPPRYVVVLKDSGEDPGSVAADHSRRYGAQVSHVYRFALKGYAASVPAERAAALLADERVDFLSPERSYRLAAQTVPTGVNRIEGDTSSTGSGNGTGAVGAPGVAVIDTGSGPHSDLNVVGGRNCIGGKATKFADGNGHGTHVAGTIAAKDDGSGVVGMAPGAPIYSVRVLNNAGVGSTSSVICGIDWVTRQASSRGIRVANMSLSGEGLDDGNCGSTNGDAEHKAICRSVAAGVTYVAAAGNDGINYSDRVPAAYNEVLTVTAMTDLNGQPGGGGVDPNCSFVIDDAAVSFSNFATIGSPDQRHTIAAPGVCILSTSISGGYARISGTSMASPHVAGSAALCISRGPCGSLTPAQIVTKLRVDAAGMPPAPLYGFAGDPYTPNGNRYYGHLAHAGDY